MNYARSRIYYGSWKQYCGVSIYMARLRYITLLVTILRYCRSRNSAPLYATHVAWRFAVSHDWLMTGNMRQAARHQEWQTRRAHEHHLMTVQAGTPSNTWRPQLHVTALWLIAGNALHMHASDTGLMIDIRNLFWHIVIIWHDSIMLCWQCRYPLSTSVPLCFKTNKWFRVAKKSKVR